MRNRVLKLNEVANAVLDVDLSENELHIKNRELELKNLELQKQIKERIEAEKRAKAEKEFSETLLNNSIDAILAFDTEFNITAWNSGMTRLTGIQKPDALGEKLFHIFPDLLDSKTISQVFDGKKIVLENQAFINRKGLYEAYILPLNNGLKETIGGLVSLHDITEQKKFEQTLVKKNKELERSNSELERFAYVASHDLKEPLRMVSNYTQLLAKKYQSVLDGEAEEFIGFAVEGVHRMQALIHDLLEYSRIGQKASFSNICMNTVLYNVKQNLRSKIDECGAKIISAELPQVKGVFSQLTQLLQNLLENALKFRRAEPPLIEINAIQKEKDWIFSVKDNGIGMDNKYDEKVFIIFQRLNPREKYPGNGIGLTICKKITELHGGNIWFKSVLGKGTTFYFSIPVQL